MFDLFLCCMYNDTANIYLDAKIECLRMSQKQLKIKEPPGSSLCCIERQTCHVLVTFKYECPHIFFGFNGVYRLMTVTVLYVKKCVFTVDKCELRYRNQYNDLATGCLTEGSCSFPRRGKRFSLMRNDPTKFGALSDFYLINKR